MSVKRYSFDSNVYYVCVCVYIYHIHIIYDTYMYDSIYLYSTILV